jgi:hypothetical protein
VIADGWLRQSEHARDLGSLEAGLEQPLDLLLRAIALKVGRPDLRDARVLSDLGMGCAFPEERDDGLAKAGQGHEHMFAFDPDGVFAWRPLFFELASDCGLV